MKPTQEQLILDYLKQGRGLTPIEALNMFGVFRLASRINSLRKEHEIETETVHHNGKSYARYSLKKAEYVVEANGQMVMA